MTEEQYIEICAICDSVLLAPDSTIERVAIPWLHPIREHPVFLLNYSEVLTEERPLLEIKRRGAEFLRNAAYRIRQLGRAMAVRGESWSASCELPKKIDVLIISHFLNASQAGGQDFYFGALPEELSRMGYTVLVALLNHSSESGSALIGRWTPEMAPRVVFSNSLGILAEASLDRKLKAESARLRRLAQTKCEGLGRRVVLRAAREARFGQARTTRRLGIQIGALVSYCQPRAVVVLHEGHAWERIAFAAAREAHPGVRCIGYQHATLFRLQHAVRRNLGGRYDPEHVLTSGSLGGRLLGEAKGLKGLTTSVLGSNRGFSGKGAPWASDKAAAGRCLVLPEGIVSECQLLFEFSIRCAELCPEIEFIWRLHPLVTFESVQAGNSKLRNLPPNIRRSVATFDADLAGCNWALYRGTTAVVRAVGAGLRPVYLRIPGEMTIDPLYELEGWKASVEKPDDFKKLVAIEVATPQAGPGATGAELVRDYCQRMFEPFKPEELARLIGPASS